MKSFGDLILLVSLHFDQFLTQTPESVINLETVAGTCFKVDYVFEGCLEFFDLFVSDLLVFEIAFIPQNNDTRFLDGRIQAYLLNPFSNVLKSLLS